MTSTEYSSDLFPIESFYKNQFVVILVFRINSLVALAQRITTKVVTTKKTPKKTTANLFHINRFLGINSTPHGRYGYQIIESIIKNSRTLSPFPSTGLRTPPSLPPAGGREISPPKGEIKEGACITDYRSLSSFFCAYSIALPHLRQLRHLLRQLSHK